MVRVVAGCAWIASRNTLCRLCKEGNVATELENASQSLQSALEGFLESVTAQTKREN